MFLETLRYWTGLCTTPIRILAFAVGLFAAGIGVAELRRVRAASVMPAHPVKDAVLWHKAVLRDGAQLDVGSDKIVPRVEEIAALARVPVSG